MWVGTVPLPTWYGTGFADLGKTLPIFGSGFIGIGIYPTLTYSAGTDLPYFTLLRYYLTFEKMQKACRLFFNVKSHLPGFKLSFGE